MKKYVFADKKLIFIISLDMNDFSSGLANRKGRGL